MANLFWNYKKINNRPLWIKIVLPFLLVIGVSYLQLEFFPSDVITAQYALYIAVLIFSGCYGGAASMLSAFVAISCFMFIIPHFLTIQNIGNHRLFTVLFILEAFIAIGLVWTIQEAFKRFRQKELKFKKMVEQTEEAFVIVNEKNCLTYYTPAFQGILGFTDEELKNKEFYDLLHPDDRKNFEFELLKLITHKGVVKHWKGRLRNRNNGEVWVELSVTDLLYDDSINGFIIHLNNIDGQIKKDTQKEDFVHMATHELKSPVTVLKGYLQILLNRFKKEAGNENLQMLEKMDSQLNRLLTLISDMLDATRIKSGELNHYFAFFDINSCIRTCADGIAISNSECKIEYDLDESIPPIMGDRDRIHQVLNNFLTNALKYSPDNKQVKIRSLKTGDYLKIIVKDHGIGIPQSKASQVFERFYRVDTLPKGVFEGLGLGLFICAEIIKKHNGQIGVNSEEGKGSEFWFTLPIL